MEYKDLAAMILATGALGTAAFGIVEALKHTFLGLMGFKKIRQSLGDPLMNAISPVYGRKSEELFQAQYRQSRKSGGLGKTLRQGIRIGLNQDNAAALADELGVVDGDDLKRVAEILSSSDAELNNAERGVLARYELAADARIDAGLALAESSYIGSMRIAASCVALLLAFLAMLTLDGDLSSRILRAGIVGLAAVPLAPIAKDVVKGLSQARTALGARK